MKNKPIVVRMAGGLANRMFQYSFSLYLTKMGYDVFVDNNYKATTWKMEDIEWEKIFPYAELRQASNSLIMKYGGGYDFISKIRRHYLPVISSVYMAPNAFTVPAKEDLKRYHYLIGTCQNPDVVNIIEKEIINKFTFSTFSDKQNLEIEQEIKETESVSIHVRKGKDYLIRPNYKGTCSIDYYKDAVKYITENTRNPKFYLFTDNPEWVKDNLSFFDYKLVNHNPSVGWGNHFDMQLMSLCKHNIIANSTYSWWGAFLNKKIDKIVIGPNNWFNKEMEEYKEYNNNTLCKGWVAL